MAYGQLATRGDNSTEAALTHILPSGEVLLLAGWRAEERNGTTFYLGPRGEVCDTIQYAAETFKRECEGEGQSQRATLRVLNKIVQDLKEGEREEQAPAPVSAGAPAAEEKAGTAHYFTLSQLDDWLHRGTHAIVRNMNLYTYSMWVFRVELTPFYGADASGQQAKRPRFIDIPFDESYPPRTTWVQRLATEPRVPMLEGMQFVTAAQDPETHFMLKSIILRPLNIVPAEGECHTRQQRTLETYRQLCTAPPDEPAWPALGSGPDTPGPFQRGFTSFFATQLILAEAATRETLRAPRPRWPSLWETAEVQKRLAGLARSELPQALTEPCDESEEHAVPQQSRMTVQEYNAFVAVHVSANFDGIANARTEKPKRQIDADCQVAEAPVAREGGGNDGSADVQVEGAEERARLGLGMMGQNVRIAQRLDADTLDRVLRFETKERRTAYSKELCSLPLMSEGDLPAPSPNEAGRKRQEKLRDEVLLPYGGDRAGGVGGLAALSDVLKDVITAQQQHFKTAAGPEAGAESDTDVPPDPEVPRASPPPADDLPAFFAPCDRWRLPSDFVAYQAQRFEDGLTTPPGKKFKKKKLSFDQVLFLAQFAAACNAVWDDTNNGVAVSQRRRFTLLLMGQGGSGKTAVVQEIVLPTMDFLFPPESDGRRSSLIACASWAQAENISTTAHKAVSCHNAASMRVQSLRNTDMLPGNRLPSLERRWGHLILTILEEVGMISPALFNMLLYRSFHGRRVQWEVSEPLYDKLEGAFGRMPIVIYLGDFLQLRPTASLSLLDNLTLLPHNKDVPAEHQWAMKLFMRTPLCFELQGTNRFEDDRLRQLMEYMRSPTQPMPPHVKASWRTILAKESGLDPRLLDERFQNGHMLGIYWETVGRWVMMRARRDAAALRTPLFLLQAADTASPPLTRDLAAKLLNHYNPHETGHIHGMFPVHLGMRVRLLVAIDKTKGLVQEAEGVVVHVAVNPKDQARVDDAFADVAGQRGVYLEHVPLGVWVRMDKYTGSPFKKELQEVDGDLTPSLTDSLVFVEPTQTLMPFKWRGHSVTRVGCTLSHACVRTSTACQGKTLEGGIVIDCGRREDGAHPMSDDTWWLHLYVMLSRATKLENLLLLRPPDESIVSRGPPADMLRQLQVFDHRVQSCRASARALAQQLGLDKFFH
jgi:hypothetical protein